MTINDVDNIHQCISELKKARRNLAGKKSNQHASHFVNLRSYVCWFKQWSPTFFLYQGPAITADQ